MAGNGIEASTAKLPGIVMIVAGAFAFAIGTIASKRFPMALPLMTSSALQIGIGCVPVALAGLLFEHPRFEALSMAGWAFGTPLVPVVGVLAAGAMLHEPLGVREISALVFTLGVAPALRS
jgi:drug/metabolite transporter (DMT)-like permease